MTCRCHRRAFALAAYALALQAHARQPSLRHRLDLAVRALAWAHDDDAARAAVQDFLYGTANPEDCREAGTRFMAFLSGWMDQLGIEATQAALADAAALHPWQLRADAGLD